MVVLVWRVGNCFVMVMVLLRFLYLSILRLLRNFFVLVKGLLVIMIFLLVFCNVVVVVIG